MHELIRKSFVHIPGIGVATEKRLWDRGFADWDLLRAALPNIYAANRAEQVAIALERSEQAWAEGDLEFFFECFPKNECWRFLAGHEKDVAFLDIESDGMGMPPYSRSTTITFFFRGEVLQAWEYDTKQALLDYIDREAKLYCTFFGEVFDLPFLRREFNRKLTKPHLDLCFWLKRHGYRGGLKRVEKMFPDIPSRVSMDIDGFDAVRLWKMHERGMATALETLLTYNAEDTIVLAALLEKAYNREVLLRPHLDLQPIRFPAPPILKTKSDPAIYARLKSDR